MKLLIAIILTTFFFSCNNDQTQKSTAESKTSAGITEKSFGNYEGKPVTQYTIANKNGMQVSVINYGGRVTKIITPDKNGEMGDVVTGFESLDGYLQNNEPHFGSLVGRYANRIANAKFSLDGKEYTLAANNHGNSLHGGNKGYDKVYWDITKLSDSSLKLNYQSKDGEEGYPGNLSVGVIYTLTSDNGLKIEYTATTDKPTPVNLSNHSYFNLSAGKDSTILNHFIQINADKYTPVNDLLIPTGEIVNVSGGPMDFIVEKQIGKDIAQVKGGGYDHNWVLNKKGNALEKVATLYDPGSGREMEVFTTEPGLQFYTGNFLDGTLTNTKGGAKYVLHGALCLETQHFPNSPNQPNFPSTILRPGETYHHTTIYRFSVRK